MEKIGNTKFFLFEFFKFDFENNKKLITGIMPKESNVSEPKLKGAGSDIDSKF
jgi:hypothetical protein